MHGKLHDDNVVATTGWRTEFLNQMGLVIPDSIDAVRPRSAAGVHSARQDQVGPRRRRPADLDDRKRRRIRPTAGQSGCGGSRSRSVFTTKDQAGAIAFASPLSYPVVADQLPPLIANVLH